jgi:hypothetical protein
MPPLVAAIPLIAGAAATAMGAGAMASAAIATGASIGLSYFAKQKAKKEAKKQAAKEAAEAEAQRGFSGSLQYGGIIPRAMAFGLNVTEGHIFHFNQPGDHKLIQYVYVLSDGYCTSLEAIWIEGSRRALVSLPIVGTEHARYRVDGYAHTITLYWHDGRPGQTADSVLVAQANPSGSWTTAHKLTNTCYIVVHFEHAEGILDTIPILRFEFKGNKVYDFRFDSTNGVGVGTCRFDDISTWIYTQNPVVIESHYRRGFFVNGICYFGMGINSNFLHLPAYVSAANLCDEDVAYSGGSEDRYRVNTYLVNGEEHIDNLELLHKAMAGVVVERSGGLYVPLPGAAQSTVFTFTDSDLVEGTEIEFNDTLPWDIVVNTVRSTYREPSIGYGVEESAELTDPTYVAIDGGEIRSETIDLTMVASKTQAERIQAIFLRENRFQARAVVHLPIKFLRVEAGDWVLWNSARYGTRYFRVAECIVTPEYHIRNSLTEVHPDVYGTGTLTLEPYTPPITPGYPVLPTTVSNFAVNASSEPLGDGRSLPVIDVSFLPIFDQRVKRVLVQLRVVGTTLVTQFDDDSVEDGAFRIRSVDPNVAYEARATIVCDPPRPTSWTNGGAWTPVSTPNVATISAAQFAADVDALVRAKAAEVQAGIERTVVRAEEMMERLAALSAETNSDRWLAWNTTRERLEVVNGNARASIEEERFLRVSGDEAVAAQVFEINAAFGGGAASYVAAVEVRVSGIEDGLATKAEASALEELSVTIGDHTSSITNLQNVTVDHEGRLDATWSLVFAEDGAAYGGLVATGAQRPDGTGFVNFGFYGNVIVNGTLHADKLVARSGTFAMLAVGTLTAIEVSGNAFTEIFNTSWVGTAALGASETTFHTFTVTPSGGKVLFNGNFNYDVGTGGFAGSFFYSRNDFIIRVSIYRDGVRVFQDDLIATVGYSIFNHSHPSTGTIQLSGSPNPAFFYASDGQMSFSFFENVGTNSAVIYTVRYSVISTAYGFRMRTSRINGLTAKR